MKTDISIYDFLALGPDAFRILTGGKRLEGAYTFSSETFKDIERRIDALYIPVDHDSPVWLLEFQVEKRSTALYNLLTKIGLCRPGPADPHRRRTAFTSPGALAYHSASAGRASAPRPPERLARSAG